MIQGKRLLATTGAAVLLSGMVTTAAIESARADDAGPANSCQGADADQWTVKRSGWEPTSPRAWAAAEKAQQSITGYSQKTVVRSPNAGFNWRVLILAGGGC
ncbi:hypothetical protein PZ938_04060 [Luteipulveratus sp. YIM 133132]|uniref:hypothetical protein n=1 Tax=Luteipulveratus flavus TaxID=3031728 RepID=UPI0023AEA3AF|nr:hypothetical protein [Luteipulveratus sp. YIM 133132]MDE9364768.1 hypothetical protein [Luteipulveratus sp. YIM 133132]